MDIKVVDSEPIYLVGYMGNTRFDYIYKVWFPQSSCQLNEQAKYDFARYGEIMDEKGQNNIEVWIPII